MNRWIPAIAVLVLGALLLWIGRETIRPLASTEQTDPPVLRVYPVPVERAEALRAALYVAVGKRGSVSLPAPDRLLVLAPEALQASIADSLPALAGVGGAAETPPPVIRPVRIELWVVDVSEGAVPDARLDAIRETLLQVQAQSGAPGFELLTKMTLLTNVGAGGKSIGDDRARATLALTAASGDAVGADISLNSGRMDLRTQTRLTLGQIVVLAQATPTDDGRTRIRLVIVRAEAAGS